MSRKTRGITDARSSREIRKFFAERGCTVVVTHLGESYRDGGEICIYAPGVEPGSDAGFSFEQAPFDGFDDADYDGRGRRYSVWLVTSGEFVPATPAEYSQAAAERRMMLAEDKRSCSSSLRFFVHRAYRTSLRPADLVGEIAALGL